MELSQIKFDDTGKLSTNSTFLKKNIIEYINSESCKNKWVSKLSEKFVDIARDLKN